mgnify:CR=1 FL=1
MPKGEERDFYDEKEVMPSERREAYYNDKLREIVQFAYENAPAIKDMLNKASIIPSQIQSVKDLEKLPVTKKDNMIALEKASLPFGGFLAVPVSSVERIYTSPGPIYEPSPPTETLVKSFYAAGLRAGDIATNTFSYHLTPVGFALDEALRKLGVIVVPTGPGNTELQIQIMHDLKVTAYVGTPSFLITIIERAEKLGYNFRKDFSLQHG